jgi:hypothetical protein
VRYRGLILLLFLIGCAPAPVHIPPIHDTFSSDENPNAIHLQFTPVFATDLAEDDFTFEYGDGRKEVKSQRYFSQNWQLEIFHPLSLGVVLMTPLVIAGPLSPAAFIRYEYSFRTSNFFHTLSPWLSGSYTADAKGWGQPLKWPFSAGLFYSFSFNKARSALGLIRLAGAVGFQYSRSYLLEDPYLPFLTYDTNAVKTPFLLRFEQIGFPFSFGYRGFFFTVTPAYNLNFLDIRDPSVVCCDSLHVKGIQPASPWSVNISVGVDLRSATYHTGKRP